MGTAEDGSSQSSRKVVPQAPGPWRTDLQRQGLSVPGREVVQSRVVEKGKPLLTLAE
jgi:hypothetical protein